MWEIIVGIIVLLLFTKPESSNKSNDNDELIRPILMDHFRKHGDTNTDFNNGENDFNDFDGE